MTWNWQQPKWPDFVFEHSLIVQAEDKFLQNAGFIKGMLTHIADDEKMLLTVDALSLEAMKTSEIEGEFLNRESLQSSIRRNFGLTAEKQKIRRAEQGIADMVTGLYESYKTPLNHEILFDWHQKLMADNREINDIGRYRTHADPMQVVSGALHKPKIHFEAPPSSHVPMEMNRFIDWFNESGPTGKRPLPAMARAGFAHLYFESIHPFEDGNGRIGRALILKALSQNTHQPLLLALSHTIQQRSKTYYKALEKNNKSLQIDSRQAYFAETILLAQDYTKQLINFIVEKGKFYQRFKSQMNERQEKALGRMLKDGPDSFPSGLNAEKYISITGTSRATATRDLQDLVDKGIFTRSGERKATRYYLPFLKK